VREGDPHVDFGADQRVWNRVEVLVDLDVIIEIDARAFPFGELLRQGVEGVALDLLEQLAATDAEFAHRPLVHALDGERDGGVAFGEPVNGIFFFKLYCSQ